MAETMPSSNPIKTLSNLNLRALMNKAEVIVLIDGKYRLALEQGESIDQCAIRIYDQLKAQQRERYEKQRHEKIAKPESILATSVEKEEPNEKPEVKKHEPKTELKQTINIVEAHETIGRLMKMRSTILNTLKEYKKELGNFNDNIMDEIKEIMK